MPFGVLTPNAVTPVSTANGLAIMRKPLLSVLPTYVPERT